MAPAARAQSQSHPRPKRSRTSSVNASRPSQSMPKTEVSINVYDLLPLQPGRLSSLLWTLGSSLLHSGVVVNGREYAYGGHNKRHATGVYFTKPCLAPPGGTFRLSLLQGFTFSSPADIDRVVKHVSDRFLGTAYNLLTNNCNHFTSALCEELTGKAAPAWLNRAASIGLALPCVVPREWVSPPEYDTAEGDLLDAEEEEDEEGDERAAMLESERRRRRRADMRRQEDLMEREAGEEATEESGRGSVVFGRRAADNSSTPPPRLASVKDSSGREMPVAERAPIPK